MNHLTPTGECGCRKPDLSIAPLNSDEDDFYIEWSLIQAQSRFHAEAIRETVEKMLDLWEQEEGMTEYFEKQKRTLDAVLKCMEGE
jgi:hypothetical protein